MSEEKLIERHSIVLKCYFCDRDFGFLTFNTYEEMKDKQDELINTDGWPACYTCVAKESCRVEYPK